MPLTEKYILLICSPGLKHIITFYSIAYNPHIDIQILAVCNVQNFPLEFWTFYDVILWSIRVYTIKNCRQFVNLQ